MVSRRAQTLARAFLLSQGRRMICGESVSNTTALKNISGTVVLAGAGKMGGAMLSGWLAQGLDRRRVAVIEPHPSDEIRAHLARGARLHPLPQDTGAIAAFVMALKPQAFREAGPALKPYID
ncbi:MAG: hypothetical protein WBW45_23410, partial [Bradyrhizobium sp.]